MPNNKGADFTINNSLFNFSAPIAVEILLSRGWAQKTASPVR
jgi:hypothetical protein